MAHLVSTPRCCVLDLHRENLTRKRPDFSRLLFFVQIVQIRFVLNLVFFSIPSHILVESVSRAYRDRLVSRSPLIETDIQKYPLEVRTVREISEAPSTD